MEYEYWIVIGWTVVIGAVIGGCVYVYLLQWRRVGRQRRKLTRQGINGPPPSWLHGNAADLHRITAQSQSKTSSESESESKGITHDFVPTVFPYLHQWAKEYGRVYTYTIRNKQNLYVGSPELVREMNQNMSTDLGKPTHLTKQLFPLFGNGILRSNGPVWTRQRKIIAPEFYMDKIKAMVGLMSDASELVLSKWDDAIEAAGGGQGKPVEVRVDEDLRSFSADVIARACFGSSYSKGKQIFSKLRTIQKTLSAAGFLFNSSKFTLRKSDKERETLQREKEVDALIWDTVQERVRNNTSPDAHKDLMQLLLDGALQSDTSDDSATKDFVIDNCKNIYFAGHETTAVSSAWCLVLLSLYPDWQRRLRQEVHEVFHFNDAHLPPSFDALNKMKWLSMFIQEALRLYSPGAFVTREALKDVQLGELLVPKGVLIWTLIPALHRDPEMWGPDAHEFKPERFAGGVANACKVPQAYVPFGVGPRNCLGKNFAMLELKLLICSILQRFSFSLSPNYQHSPAFTMVVEPANGVYLMMNKIECS